MCFKTLTYADCTRRFTFNLKLDRLKCKHRVVKITLLIVIILNIYSTDTPFMFIQQFCSNSRCESRETKKQHTEPTNELHSRNYSTQYSDWMLAFYKPNNCTISHIVVITIIIEKYYFNFEYCSGDFSWGGKWIALLSITLYFSYESMTIYICMELLLTPFLLLL